MILTFSGFDLWFNECIKREFIVDIATNITVDNFIQPDLIALSKNEIVGYFTNKTNVGMIYD